MSENIQSIANGTYTIGETNKLTFSAGPGSVIDEPSAGTVRIGNDETVLWSAEGGAFSLTASESIYNFEYIDVWQAGGTEDVTMRIPTKYIAKNNDFATTKTYLDFVNQLYTFGAKYSVSNNGTVLESTGKGYGYVVNIASTTVLEKYSNNEYNGKISKVVGINRIGGNA